MAQWVRCMLHKPEDLSSDPQNPRENRPQRESVVLVLETRALQGLAASQSH